jgi:hypothetical protein
MPSSLNKDTKSELRTGKIWSQEDDGEAHVQAEY